MIGILALQGDYAAHGAILAQLGYDWREVRTTSELQSVDGLILPGGESGALLRLMDDELFLALSKFEKPIFGTCAGAILLASKVSNPEQKSLGKIDIDIQRNGYGRQLDSFETDLAIDDDIIKVAFIRAPKITSIGAGVDVLASHNDQSVLVRQGNFMAATFHPEVTKNTYVHKIFCEMLE